MATEVWIVMLGTEAADSVVSVHAIRGTAFTEADRLQADRTVDQRAWDYYVSGPWPLNSTT